MHRRVIHAHHVMKIYNAQEASYLRTYVASQLKIKEW